MCSTSHLTQCIGTRYHNTRRRYCNQTDFREAIKKITSREKVCCLIESKVIAKTHYDGVRCAYRTDTNTKLFIICIKKIAMNALKENCALEPCTQTYASRQSKPLSYCIDNKNKIDRMRTVLHIKAGNINVQYVVLYLLHTYEQTFIEQIWLRCHSVAS